MPKLAVKNRGMEEEKQHDEQNNALEKTLTFVGAILIVTRLSGVYLFNCISWNYNEIMSFLHIEIPYNFYLMVVLINIGISIPIMYFGFITVVINILIVILYK